MRAHACLPISRWSFHRWLLGLASLVLSAGSLAGADIKPEVIFPLTSFYWDADRYGRAAQGGDDRVLFPLRSTFGYQCGVILSFDPATRAVTQLAQNASTVGCWPSPLMVDEHGVLWGTAYFNGPNDRGSLFRIPVGGQPEVVHAFTEAEGYAGYGPPVVWPGGGIRLARNFTPLNEFGQLERFEAPDYQPVVYKLFTDADGMRYPVTPATLGDGFLYGLAGFTDGGGRYLFRASESGELEVVATYADRDANNDIVNNGDGHLYLTNRWKRRVGSGSGDRLVKIGPDKEVTELHRYHCRTGCHPEQTPILAQDGWLYGMADGGKFDSGVIYRVRPDGSAYQQIYHFDGTKAVGAYPRGGLFQARDGYIYGRTVEHGTLFRFMPPP